MTTKDVAQQLMNLLPQGKYNEIYDTLFHTEKVRHIEPQSPHFADLTGVLAIKEKDQTMGANIASVEDIQVGEAVTSANHIALPYKIAFTLKDGQSVTLDEIILYEVEEGKIISEQFFY